MDNNVEVKKEAKLKNEPKMSYDVAFKQLIDWMSTHHDEYDAKSEDDFLESNDNLIRCMMNGRLILKEDGGAEYKLKYPVEGQQDGRSVVVLDKLVFKTRVKYRDIKNIIMHINPKDRTGQLFGYIAGYTGQPIKLLEEMDLYDVNRVQTLSVFFIKS